MCLASAGAGCAGADRMAESKSAAIPQSAPHFGGPQYFDSTPSLRDCAPLPDMDVRNARGHRRCRSVPRAQPVGPQFNWGGWIRTNAWRSQSPLPYRLATPQCAARIGDPIAFTALRRFATARPHGHSPWGPRTLALIIARETRGLSSAAVRALSQRRQRAVAIRRFAPMYRDDQYASERLLTITPRLELA
jgi:hypothetical protein